MICLKRYDLKNVTQVVRRPTTLSITSYCLTITRRSRFYVAYKSLRNHVQKYHVFSSQGVRTVHFYYKFTANSASEKNRKAINIYQSYEQKFSVSIFGSQCRRWMHYLGGGFNRCSVLQQKFNNFDPVLLARDVQWRKTVLHANELNFPFSSSLLIR